MLVIDDSAREWVEREAWFDARGRVEEAYRQIQSFGPGTRVDIYYKETSVHKFLSVKVNNREITKISLYSCAKPYISPAAFAGVTGRTPG